MLFNISLKPEVAWWAMKKTHFVMKDFSKVIILFASNCFLSESGTLYIRI